MSFDPCLEWLGIPAVELVSAHAVLGVGRGETDARVIAAAAEERLRILRGVAPGPFGKAHAALIARVVAARDEMLAVAPPVPRQPPQARVPPPVPSRTGFSGGNNAAATAEMPAIVIAGGPPRRRRSQSGGLVAFLAMIAVVAATAAAYVAWPRADAGSARKDGSTRKVASRSGDAQPPEATMAESPQMAPRERQDLPAAEAERREPDRDEPSAASPAETAPAERQSPEPAEPVAAAQPATVEVSIREAFAALRRKDHAAARQAIADARKAVGDNDFGGRVSRWHLLVTYAEQLAVHLEQAIASANEGREYQIGNLIISVIEITPTTYAFKEGGQIRRGPRERMPKAIERAILEQWFIADGRAANHILLGVHLLLDDPSRLPDVRTEWDIAMAGEPATAAILPLLEDPLLAGSAD